MAKRYTVSDGKLVLTLETSREGGYVVSSPLYPGLWTQAQTIAEAFDNAADALKALIDARNTPLAKATSARRNPKETAA